MKNRRFLTAADASQSVVSGPGIANVAAGTNNTVIVTAKSSGGGTISTGGDIFASRITNRCTKYNQYYCKPTGASGPISGTLMTPFGDLNNGNYSIYYHIGNTGAISVQAYLLEQGKVYHEYYSGNFAGSSSSNCLVNGINFSDSNTSNYCLSVSDEISAKIITFIKSPYTGTVSFSYSCDLKCSIYIEDNNYATTSSSGTFDISMTQNLYYSLYIEWYNADDNFGVSLSWSYSGQSNIAIPSSYIYLPRLVGSSPYNINVVSSVCGDGYRTGSESCDDSDTTSGNGCDSSCSVENGWTCSGGSSSSKDVCTDICGDGKKLSKTSTFCDDGNTSNGDGCDSNCSLETGWTCSGGNSSTKDTCFEICGDGKRYNSNSSYCDDGNTSSGDGCSSSCSKETGFTCSGGSTLSKDTCTEVCGDGKRYSTVSTSCDDGNTLSNDGCNSSCNIEIGWTCSGGSSSTIDICTEICGDGKRFNTISAYCDDGNTLNGDGCNSTCSIETGFTCTGGSLSTKDSCSEVCGDGKRYSSVSTFCDDGNTNNGDGCSSTCSNEIGWSCSGGSSSTKDTCSEICGDGKRFNSVSTYCDDGNSSNGDGCNSSCNIEAGWTCSGGNTSTKDICSEICGDGKRYNSNSSYCDDGNTSSGDGCSSSCSKETGWTCSGGSTLSKDTCTEVCGDGKRFNSISTYCDDGNTSNGDGCSSSCSKETGWTCSGGNSSAKDSCSEICGDGKRFNTISTYCDDGNTSNGDGCNSGCSKEIGWSCSGGNSSTKDACSEICGDGKRFNSVSTYCDDGNTSPNDGCSSSCSVEIGWTCSGGNSSAKDSCSEICGDGKRFNTISTYCDDGNTSNGDGCSSSCSKETGWTCSGGNSSTKDACIEICGDGIRFNNKSTYCDDGNTSSGDGCDSSCSKEIGWSCSGGNSSNKDICVEICGDGKKFNSKSTYCDDGNNISNDGCSSSCQIESGWSCTGGTSTKADLCEDICGDGLKLDTNPLKCDDGNVRSSDGCSKNCFIEDGYKCIVNQNHLSICERTCGNGILEPQYNEQCDDRNFNSGDGCSSLCKLEALFQCSLTKSNLSICTRVCGNGVFEPQSQELCDDGNTKSGDGCNYSCSIEPKYYCVTLAEQHNLSYCRLYCSNGIIDSGEDCDDGNVEKGDGCDNDCHIELAYNCTNFSDKPSFCYPLCGNGKRDATPFIEECDDGNNLDLDGCNSKCKVEKSYNCIQNLSGTDICKTIYSPPDIISSIFDQLTFQIVIEFDQTMLKQNLTLFDMDLDIIGQNSPYSVTWTAEYDNNKLKISFTTSPVLLGGIGEKIRLQFTNVAAFKNMNEIAIKELKLLEFTVSAFSSSENVQSGGSGASYTFVFALLISLGVSLFTGGSIELMWSLANSLQIIFFFGYLNLYYTPELLVVFSYMKFANFDNPIFEYIREKTYNLVNSLKIPIPSNSQLFGLSSTSVIINFMDKIMVIILLGLLIVSLFALSYFLENRDNKVANFIKRKDLEIRYEGVSRFYIEIALGLSFVTFVNIIFGQASDPFSIVSCAFASLFLISSLYVILYCFLYPKIYYSDICIYPEIHERHCLLFLEFNKDYPRNLYFYGYFLIHRITFAFIVACMSDFPIDQCVLICFLNILMLIYTFKVYKNCLNNFLHTFNCLILIALSLMLPMFLSSDDANKLKISGYVRRFNSFILNV